MKTSPEAGLKIPLKCFTIVVFPAPFCPIIATGSVPSIVKSIPFNASSPVGYT